MEARAVLEIVALPDIVPLDETPDYVAGVVDVRGQIVPVIDLNLRFGHSLQRHCLEDCIVILERAGTAVGIIVNKVESVIDITPAGITPVPSHGLEAQPDSVYLTGLARSGEQIVMLLHLDNLLGLSQSVTARQRAEGIVPATVPNFVFPDATPHETAIFRERARSLAQPPEAQDRAGVAPLAVVRLGEELFGIELRAIREFAELRSVTPVPCCPGHIVGQINLRGGLLVLIDIAGPLGLPPTRGRGRCSVIVVNNADLGAGVLVDEVLDICYLRAEDVTPASTSARSLGQDYLRGTAPYGTRMLSLLDLPALLKHASLIVNEKP